MTDPETSPDPRLSSMLDRLADADRAAAPPDLERRVLEATRASLAGGDAPAVVARIGFHRRPAFRLAAAVALAAGVGLATMPLWRPGPPPAPAGLGAIPTEQLVRDIASDLDAWLAESGATPALEPVAGDLASLSGELADAESIIVDFWTLDDPLRIDPIALGLEESL
jgi:hypothetical protein